MIIKRDDNNTERDYKEMLRVFFSYSSTKHLAIEHAIGMYVAKKYINRYHPEDDSFTLDDIKKYASQAIYTLNESYVVDVNNIFRLIFGYAKCFMLLTYHEYIPDYMGATGDRFSMLLDGMGFSRVISRDELPNLEGKEFNDIQIAIAKGFKKLYFEK